MALKGTERLFGQTSDGSAWLADSCAAYRLGRGRPETGWRCGDRDSVSDAVALGPDVWLTTWAGRVVRWAPSTGTVEEGWLAGHPHKNAQIFWDPATVAVTGRRVWGVWAEPSDREPVGRPSAPPKASGTLHLQLLEPGRQARCVASWPMEQVLFRPIAADDGLYVATTRGLQRLRAEGEPAPEQVPGVGIVTILMARGSTVLACGPDGAYRVEAGRSTRLWLPDDLRKADWSWCWVGDEGTCAADPGDSHRTVMWLQDGTAVPLRGLRVGGSTSGRFDLAGDLYNAPKYVVCVTPTGQLWRWPKGDDGKPDWARSDMRGTYNSSGRMAPVADCEGRLLGALVIIGDRSWYYPSDGDTSAPPLGPWVVDTIDTTSSIAAVAVGDPVSELIIVAGGTVWRASTESGQAVPILSGLVRPSEVGLNWWTTTTSLYLGSSWGLSQIDGLDGSWDAEVAIEEGSLVDARPGSCVRWRLPDLGFHTPTDRLLQRVTVTDHRGATLADYQLPPGSVPEWTVPSGLGSGSCWLSVELTDLVGNRTASPPVRVELRGERSGANLATWVAGGFTASVLLAFLVNAAVVTLAGHWKLCFDVLSQEEPVGKMAFLRFVVPRVPVLRRALFGWYYRDRSLAGVAGRSARHAFVKLTLRGPGTKNTPATDLLETARDGPRQVWLAGGSGSGKTTVVEEVVDRYFDRGTSLRARWREYGFVPVLIRVRDLASGALEERAQHALAHAGMYVGHRGLLADLLRSGACLLIVDGANEGDVVEDIRRFATAHPRVPLVVTSQCDPRDWDIAVLRTPECSEEFGRELLRALLAHRPTAGPADELARPEVTALLRHVSSAYDVQLIADLLRAGRGLPGSAQGLYAEKLRAAELAPAEEEALCRLAWDLWRMNRRRFRCDDSLTEEAASRAVAPADLLVRRGDDLEFSHDVIWGYLAALRCTHYVQGVAETIGCLAEEAPAAVSAEHLSLVLRFVPALVRDEEDLQALAAFALGAPVRWALLLEQCVRTAQLRGWAPEVRFAGRKADGGPLW